MAVLREIIRRVEYIFINLVSGILLLAKVLYLFV